MRYCAALVLLPAVALMACGLIGCGGGRYRPGYIPPDGAVQTPIPLPEAPGPTPFHEAAYVRYSRGDYVRALRDAYRAAEAPLPDDRLPFFIGLVYDTGFNRPDLAIPEYRRFLRHRPGGKAARRLRQRVHFLRRRDLEGRAAAALVPGSAAPLSGARLAVFPLRAAGPRRPQPGLALGLLDVIARGLGSASDTLVADPLEAHILWDAFQMRRPGATPAEFARWTGAQRTLTGSFVDLGDHRVRIAIQVLDEQGNPVYEGKPVTGDLAELGLLLHPLLENAAKGLGVRLDAPLADPDIPLPLPLLLYGKGLQEYLSGQLPDAQRHLLDARELAPHSDLISTALGWTESELAERQGRGSLAALYRALMTQPPPDLAAWRHLQATHSLTVPPLSISTGAEQINPYKAPHTGANP